MGANSLPLTRRSTEELHSAGSGRKNHVRPSRKAQSLRVPPGKLLKAQQMLVEGHSQRQVAQKLRMSEHTVAKVVRTEDFQTFIREQRERLFAIAPDAIESFHAQVKIDGRLAYVYLKDLGIIPSRESLVNLMASAPTEAESGLERQARMVACVLLESHKNFGVNLPPEIEKIADDPEFQDAEAPQVKISRR